MSSSKELAIYSIPELSTIASAIAKSRLFGMETPEQALTLMLIAQAEGYHPALAARDYHIIKGRPTLKSDAMLTRFHQAGGKVEWNEYTDQRVSATFSHVQGGSITVDWDIERARKADLLGNPTWKKYPRAMLRSRVISEGIRTVFPGVSVGIYTQEEADDMRYEEEMKRKTVVHSQNNRMISASESQFSPMDFVKQIDECKTIEQLKITLEINWPHINKHADKNSLVDHYNAAKKNLLDSQLKMITEDIVDMGIVRGEELKSDDQKTAS